MVKNKTGGNKSKRLGRKFVGESQTISKKLRLADELGEVYAVVSKIFGNGMFEITCANGATKLCIIRKKFKGRGKRDNCLTLGSWILAGEREWEVTTAGKEKYDLLEVYTPNDVERLKRLDLNWTHILRISESFSNMDNLITGGDDEEGVEGNERGRVREKGMRGGIVFSSTECDDVYNIIDANVNKEPDNIIGNDGDESEDIDFDDI